MSEIDVQKQHLQNKYRQGYIQSKSHKAWVRVVVITDNALIVYLADGIGFDRKGETQLLFSSKEYRFWIDKNFNIIIQDNDGKKIVIYPKKHMNCLRAIKDWLMP